MPDLGQTLTNKVGPLPTWVWAGLGTAALAGYMLYRQKQSINASQAASAGNASSTNLGTVPISNLLTAAEPMPVSVGPTFVNVSLPGQSSTTAPPVTTPSGYGSDSWTTLNTYEKNILAHTPVKGYTGSTWSKLTQAQQINLFAHTPAPGYTGLAWSKLNASQQLEAWASYNGATGAANSLTNLNPPAAKSLTPAAKPAAPPAAVTPQTTK